MTAPHLPPLRDADPRAELAMLAERRRQLREELEWLEAVMADLAGELATDCRQLIVDRWEEAHG